ncbi:GTP-binding protein [Psychromonas ossibalaenae]|uniref:GTP-binding protein n=1 Tax=Psychromonas ossibalaenae TaxID=444922 RepID=UPI0003812EE2|nr:GTP-binding protein [Psychromonas ossibalaenae]
MKTSIVCHIIAGFLDSGKSSFIKQLISYKPSHEKWAVLVNESGRNQYGKDFCRHNQVFIKEVYGGCLCCSAGMPFRVALNNLIKEVNPDRIFIEPAGAGHLKNIQHLLQSQFYLPVLTLKSCICLLSYKQLNDQKYSQNEGYLSLIKQADILCIKADKNEDEDEVSAKKMAREYAKPLYLLKGNADDFSFIEQN